MIMKEKTTGSIDNNGYKAFNNDNKESILASYGKTVDKFDGLVHGGEKSRAVTEVVTDISVRPPFGRRDYEYFRPGETVPRRFHEVVMACRGVYQNVGVVKNVIDMMT